MQAANVTHGTMNFTRAIVPGCLRYARREWGRSGDGTEGGAPGDSGGRASGGACTCEPALLANTERSFVACMLSVCRSTSWVCGMVQRGGSSSRQVLRRGRAAMASSAEVAAAAPEQPKQQKQQQQQQKGSGGGGGKKAEAKLITPASEDYSRWAGSPEDRRAAYVHACYHQLATPAS